MGRAGGKPFLEGKTSAKAETATKSEGQEATVAVMREEELRKMNGKRPSKEGVSSGCNEKPVPGFKQK